MLRHILVKFVGEEFKVIAFHIKSISFLTIAYALSSLMGFLINLLAAKKLEVSTFGLFSIAYTTTTWIAVIGNFGVGAGMIRIYNKYGHDEIKQKLVLKASLFYVVLATLIIILTSSILSSFLLQILHIEREAKFLFLLSFLSGALFILWIYLQNYHQAIKKFKILSLLVLAYSILRAIFLLLVYLYYPKSSTAWLLASYLLPISILILLFSHSFFYLLTHDFKSIRETIDLLKEVINYSKWIALSSIAGSGILYFSRVILAKVSTLEEFGIFSAGLNLAMGLTVIYTGLYSFLYPTITSFTKEQISKYFKLLVKTLPLYLLASLLGILLLGGVLWFYLGERYVPAIPVFLISSFSIGITMFLGLISMPLHTFMLAKVFAYVNIGRVFLVGLLTYLLGRYFGALGGALAYGSVMILGEIFMVYVVYNIMKKRS